MRLMRSSWSSCLPGDRHHPAGGDVATIVKNSSGRNAELRTCPHSDTVHHVPAAAPTIARRTYRSTVRTPSNVMAPSTPRPTSIESTLSGLLSPEAAAAYVRALGSPGSINASTASVAELLERGLVRVADPSGELQALPPEAAVMSALHAATAAWLAAAPNFDGVLRTINRLAPVPADPVSGPIDESVVFQQTIERLLVEAQTSMWCMQPYPEWIDEDELADQSTWTRNHETTPARVTHRFVYDQRLLKFPHLREMAMEETGHRLEIRFANWQLPTFMVIADRHTALYFPDGGRRGGEITEDPAEVGLLCLAYDAAFARAVPLLNEPSLSPTHQQIQAFLALGHSNRVIGSMLKLNERTVRRRVNELMEHHGVGSRHELVALAAATEASTAPRATGSSA